MRRSANMTEISSIDLGPPAEMNRSAGAAALAGGGRARRQPVARAALRACRPRQWSKNALLLAAPAAGGILATAAGEVAAGVVTFCMLSSATYLFNDVRDADVDRAHPVKRLRPVASGDLPARSALALSVVLALAGLGIAAAVRPALAAVGCAYLLLTACYSIWLRHVIVADMLAIAGAFVLRAVAGGAATGIGLSRWFLLVTSFGAIFVVAGKRHAELFGKDVAVRAGATRATLRRYSEPALLAVLAAAAAGTVGAYIRWAVGRPGHGPWYVITIVPVVLWLARYALLVSRGAGEAPEELILRDHALLALTLAWTALFLGGVYVGG